MSEISEKRNELISDINLFKLKGSLNIAKSTTEFLQFVVSKMQWKSARDLLDAIDCEGKIIIEALPLHVSIPNIVYQVKQLIQEEYMNAVTKTKLAVVQRFLQDSKELNDYKIPVDGLEDAILDHITEFQTELDLSVHNISEQSNKHIHSGDIIMTIGYSTLIESFIVNRASMDKKAAQFEVIVIERAPFSDGHCLAKNLAQKGITTTLVPDSSIFALMPRVNKVIISSTLILTNGGLKAVTGTHNLALAAKYHSVPVLVLAPSYKFIANEKGIIANEQTCNLYDNPQGVLNFNDLTSAKVRVHNPMFEYVPPEYVTLLISNVHETFN